MSREKKFLGIQFIKQKIVAVEILHLENEFELTSFVEREASLDYIESFSALPNDTSGLKEKLVQDLRSIRKDGGIDAPNISFCLNSRCVFIHSFPQDETFSKPERENHIAWELSNYLAPSKYEDYVTAIAKLDDLPTLGTVLMLSASARRELVSLLKEIASQLDLNLVVIDVDHFGAEHALKWNYSEIENETVALLGFNGQRVEASVLRNGKSIQYYWGEVREVGASPNIFRQIFPQSNNGKEVPKKFFVYGDSEEPIGQALLKRLDSPEREILNPLRRLDIPRRVRRMDLTGLHQYAPVIGLAMREG